MGQHNKSKLHKQISELLILNETAAWQKWHKKYLFCPVWKKDKFIENLYIVLCD